MKIKKKKRFTRQHRYVLQLSSTRSGVAGGVNEKENRVDTKIVTDPLALADRLLDLGSIGGYSLEKRQHTVETQFPFVVNQTELFPEAIHVALREMRIEFECFGAFTGPRVLYRILARFVTRMLEYRNNDLFTIGHNWQFMRFAHRYSPSIDVFPATDRFLPLLCQLKEEFNVLVSYVSFIAIVNFPNTAECECNK